MAPEVIFTFWTDGTQAHSESPCAPNASPGGGKRTGEPVRVGHRLYGEFIPPGAFSGGGAVGIVVFDLGDGSRVAVGVYCGVGPCQVMPQ